MKTSMSTFLVVSQNTHTHTHAKHTNLMVKKIALLFNITVLLPLDLARTALELYRTTLAFL